MIVDARTLSSGDVIATDVCIVGSGPAGLSLARELSNQAFKVCVLESGSFNDPTPATKSLSEVETTYDFVPMNAERWRRQAVSGGIDFTLVTPDRRNRRFGGNATAWGVKIGEVAPGRFRLGLRHVPLASADFEARDWMPESGWPFDRSHLQPFYERAHELLEMGPCLYDGDDWDDDGSQLPLNSTRLMTRVFQFSRGEVVHTQWRKEVNATENVTTYINANAMEIETDATGTRATGVKVSCIDGPTFRVTAKIVILAVGGIETAQLLLLSNQVHPEGLGNQNDLVGRYFMDHPLVYGGQIIPKDPETFNRTAIYDLHESNGTPVMGHLTFTDEALRSEPLPNISAALFPRQKRYLTPPSIKSLKAIITLRAFRERPASIVKHVANVVFGMRDICEAIYDKVTRKPLPFHSNFSTGGWSVKQENKSKVYHSFDVVHQTEQLPHRDNRVVLSEHRDVLGRRKAEIQARWMPEDIEGIRRAHQAIADEVFRSGVGKFVPLWEGELPYVATAGASHHMGTARMHNDPKKGVVDENCKVHGVENLYIASSAVFPTGGYAGPTLTIVALSIRLADHIKSTIAQKRSAGSTAGASQSAIAVSAVDVTS